MKTDSATALKILHVAPELAPMQKIGGLGDVIGALPRALNEEGTDARVLLPAYPGLLERLEKSGFPLTRMDHKVHVSLRWQVISGKLWISEMTGLTLYLLENDVLFNNPGIYPRELTPDSALPFAFLSLSALEIPSIVGWTPRIIHVHDWPAALLPCLLHWHHYYRHRGKNYRTVLTIHNLAHQGLLPPSVMDEWGMDWKAFTIDGLEYYNSVNLLKGAINSADTVTTVSPSYAMEIQASGGGHGLNTVLKANHNKIRGILNGLDRTVWNPSDDPLIPGKYSFRDMSGKALCRKALLKKFKWNDDGSPLLVFVGRLVEQKGLYLLLEAIDDLMAMKIRLIIVGSGDKALQREIEQEAGRYPRKIAIYAGYSEKIAHLAYSGGDIFLMPSLFEPCGISQLIALRYGTIPLVRATGGLADTVVDADASKEGYGFLFREYEANELVGAVKRSLSARADKERWRKIRHRGMNVDFSWKEAATQYIDLYRSILHEKHTSLSDRKREEDRI